MRSFLLIAGKKRGFASSGTLSPLTAGTITEGNHTTTIINATASAPTGGSSPYTYQWYNAADDTVISGQTTLTLSWTGRTAGTQYGYYLIATDDNSDTVQYSTVQSTTETTLVAGSITEGTHTEDTINATASAPTGGDSPYTYQWYNDADDSAISGQTTLTLAWTARAASTQYSYYLIATDSDGQTVQYTTQTSTTEATATITALDFPGSPSYPSGDPSIIMGWCENINGVTVPALGGGFTALWMAWPRAMQAAYWSGFFHTRYGTIWDWVPNGVPYYRYVGAHPYPLPAEGGATRNVWEISAAGGDTYDDTSGDVTYSRITQYQRWYSQAYRAVVSGGTVNHEFYFDLDAGTDRVILHEDDTASDPVQAERSITIGDALWNAGKEIYNGYLRGWAFYNRTLSLAEIAAAKVDPTSVSGLWYLNLNPTPTDITDKSGNGNHPTWFTTARPTLWEG